MNCTHKKHTPAPRGVTSLLVVPFISYDVTVGKTAARILQPFYLAATRKTPGKRFETTWKESNLDAVFKLNEDDKGKKKNNFFLHLEWLRSRRWEGLERTDTVPGAPSYYKGFPYSPLSLLVPIQVLFCSFFLPKISFHGKEEKCLSNTHRLFKHVSKKMLPKYAPSLQTRVPRCQSL